MIIVAILQHKMGCLLFNQCIGKHISEDLWVSFFVVVASTGNEKMVFLMEVMGDSNWLPPQPSIRRKKLPLFWKRKIWTSPK